MKLRKSKPIKYRYVYRSAETGFFVSKAFALLYPKLTIRQRILRAPYAGCAK